MLIYSAQLRPLSVILGNAISPKQFPPLMHRPRRFTSFWCRCASRGSIPSIHPQRLITSSEMAKQNTPPSRWMQEPNAISCKEKAVSDSTQKRSSFPETNLSASHCRADETVSCRDKRNIGQGAQKRARCTGKHKSSRNSPSP